MDRPFITSVSPVIMDAVTSGFNTGANISMLPEFNELLGSTEAEVRRVLEMYRERDVFLLYSLFHSGAFGAEAINTKALIYNVKGEDLLFLDRATRNSMTKAGRVTGVWVHIRGHEECRFSWRGLRFLVAVLGPPAGR